MSSNSDIEDERVISAKKRFIFSMLIPLLFLFIAYSIKLIETLEGISFVTLGIKPLSVEGMPGIIFSPLIHGDWNHLFANTVPVFVLGTALFYFYKEISFKIFVFIYLFTGAWVWIGARTGSWHIGASGVIYGLGSFLFFSGLLRNYIPLIAISLVVVFLYGGLFWGVIPVTWDLPYSWEAHLFGGISGLVLAFIYRKEGPLKPVNVWHDEDELDDDNPFWDE